MSQEHFPHSVRVLIPGKVMLAGEYAVLRGGRAVAATVARYLQVEASSDAALQPGDPVRYLSLPADHLGDLAIPVGSVPRGGFLIASDLWQTPYFMPSATDRTTLANEPLLEAVHFAMQRYKLASGSVRVDSQLDVSFGLGSSSAIRLGVLMALRRLSFDSYERGESDLFGSYARPDADWQAAISAFELQRAAQKNASGYDVATQLQGGLIFFSPPTFGSEPEWPSGIKPGSSSQQQALRNLVHIFVGGSGAPTGIVVSDTMAWLEAEGGWPMLQDLSADLVSAFDQALAGTADDTLLHEALYGAVGRHRNLFLSSPHFPKALASLLLALPGCDRTWSFKTTGAGGEDAILLLGRKEDLVQVQETLAAHGWHDLGVPFDQQGTRVQW